jgi:uncharacterized protein (TIGR02453 family)
LNKAYAYGINRFKTMIQKETFSFLQKLKANNNKAWFDINRGAYVSAKTDFIAFGQTLIDGVASFDDAVDSAHLIASRCIKRLHRDVRFSSDKSPYKTNFFLLISADGMKGNRAAYYFHLQPGKSFCGGGVYMPLAPELKLFREAIQDRSDDWLRIVESSDFKTSFTSGVEAPDALAKVPRGFDPGSPAADYLKMKGFFVVHALSDMQLSEKGCLEVILDAYRKAKPMMDFLNDALR